MCLTTSIALCFWPSYASTPRYYHQVALQRGQPWEKPDGWDLVYLRVLSGDVVINNTREFTEFADQMSSVDCLFLGKSRFIQEPEELSKAMPIPSTLNVHKVIRVHNGPHSFSNHFLKLSEDLERFDVEKYGVQFGQSVKNINGESLYNNCYKRYILGKEGLKFPVCCQ